MRVLASNFTRVQWKHSSEEGYVAIQEGRKINRVKDERSLRIDNKRHALLAMSLYRAIEPAGIGVVNIDGKDFRLRNAVLVKGPK